MMSKKNSIASLILPGQQYNFKSDIDLFDETLREGAERASVPPSLEEKCELAEAIAAVGVKTLVVGMFPDVPQNIDFLQALLDRQASGRIPLDVRFMVISHVGITMRQTFSVLERMERARDSVWIIAIHSVSDMQIEYLFPAILTKDAAVSFNQNEWEGLSKEGRRERNLAWLNDFMPSMKNPPAKGVMVGLLDAFRADQQHIENAIHVAQKHGITQIRLVDTAGTCLPHQLATTVGSIVSKFPSISFYGHFHDDFGMATANAIVGLSMGLQGVDVAVGGFANRAGHPPIAEVAMALLELYGVSLAGFEYQKLYALSRKAEQIYGLMENPAQAITGVITHAIQSGIRTELVRKAPNIFDIIDSRDIGSDLTKMFGIRSGQDGMLRFLRENEPALRQYGIEPTSETADLLFAGLYQEWSSRGVNIQEELRGLIGQYQQALRDAFFTEDAMLEWLIANAKKGACDE